jgi:hypothetical protein
VVFGDTDLNHSGPNLKPGNVSFVKLLLSGNKKGTGKTKKGAVSFSSYHPVL